MGLLSSAILTVAGIYLALVILIYFLQARLIYFPFATLEANPAQIGLAYDDVQLETDDGVQLHGWYLPAPNAAFTVLFFHGNAGNISHRLDSLRLFHTLGVNVLIFDYRGFGNSGGSPSESGTYLDASAAWRHLIEVRQLRPDQVILFGRSLGGAVASWLAVRVPARGLILESSFSSLPALGTDHYPLLPVRWLSWYRYDTQSRLASLSMPVLIAHSRDDRIVGFHHAEVLYESAPAPKTLLEMRGGHNDGFLISGDGYVHGLREFVESLR